ncbi:MAG: hypothetical protein J7623_02030 [Chitinophaga sp.]|uniref:hypothetical protein n=1 Tax=Chitinophaga sp. TaxID=1869181 RepID=UPI001B145575|nr:hypothetical protein [Chitinophaga sp.]MBO9727396.1 hypothetical protein [Chitinophaga sp.]
MKIAPRYKKWINILFILLAARIVFSMLLYFLVQHKFVRIVQYIVQKESGGNYQFDAHKIDFSLWNRNIVLHDARLVGKDTVNVNAHYDVNIPRIYLSIQSWRALIFEKKLLVDSLSVISPSLYIHEHIPHGPRTDTFQLSSIVDHLEQALQYVNARIVHLQNGSLVYSKVNGPPPLRMDHFNFSILNFSKVTTSDNHILGSDDVDFSFDNQHWILPDGRNTISFKRLHFSGKKQVFELDSCILTSVHNAGKGTMFLQADKFYFNARHLPAIYMRQELLIDTLVCIRPVLHFPGHTAAEKEKRQALDSLPNTLFRKINFKYIAVQDGALALKGQVSTGTTQKTNLRIYNLTIAHDTTPGITTDSIALNLNKIKFYSLDSMFQLSVDEFILQRNDVIFNNVEYAPTPQNHSGKGLTFTAPSLRLNNVSLEDLLRKHLKATSAELFSPRISLLTKAKKKADHKPAIDSIAIKMPAFYQTLHGLSELIMVNKFRITDGNVNLISTGKTPVTLQLKSVNTDILLHNFFLSDSLVDIKHSMPNLHIREMSVAAAPANITVSNYAFDGIHRHNKADKLLVSLANGTRITGTALYWEVFDWDVFQQSKDIQVDVIRLGTLQVQLQNTATTKHEAPKAFPVIRIAKLDVGPTQFSSQGVSQQSSFHADKISIRNLRTQQQFFTWSTASAQLRELHHHSPQMEVDIDAVSLNPDGITTLTRAKASVSNGNGYTKISLPALQLQTGIHNTDFSHLSIPSLTADQADIEILSIGKTAEKTKQGKPLQANIGQLNINNAHLQYTKVNGQDSSQLHTRVQLSANKLAVHTGSEQPLKYDHIRATATPLEYHHRNMNLSIPQLTLQLQHGKLHKGQLHSGVAVQWEEAQLGLHRGDTMELVVNKLSGIFKDARFSFHQGQKLPWESFLAHTHISQGGLFYRNQQLHASIGQLQLDTATQTLQANDFSMAPNLSAEETFRTARWQRDYITVKGNSLQLAGIASRQLPGDTTLYIRKITASNTALTTARDKRIPFEHGIEKFMPTKLINTLPIELQVDSIVLQHSAVTVNESSKSTNKWSAVPITNINALITGFGNVHPHSDSLRVQASGHLLGSPIRYFSYNESYEDSLSGFTAQSYLAPMDLKRFNEIAIPMAAVKVRRGYADTIFSQWAGNKYATLGDMNFYYRQLNIQVLNKKDSTRQGFMANLKTWLANLILRNNNQRPTKMFFIRDREKFIFNYWVKAEASGMVTAVGVKKDRKYLKRYRKVAKKYSLPPR